MEEENREKEVSEETKDQVAEDVPKSTTTFRLDGATYTIGECYEFAVIFYRVFFSLCISSILGN